MSTHREAVYKVLLGRSMPAEMWSTARYPSDPDLGAVDRR